MTRDEKIKNDPLAMVIVEVTKAMKSDYGRQYQSQFKTDDDMTQYKRRLYTKLRDYDINDIADGYELYVDSGKTFCPTIPDLLEFVEQASKRRKQLEANAAEVSRIAALPAPKIQCNPSELLRQARAKPTGNLEEVLRNHNAVLQINARHIQHREFGAEHSCAIGFCKRLGSLSHNTKGGGPFYCIEHYRQTG